MNTKIQKTKKELRTAALALAEERSVQEITVSELCKKAEINRTTFYKYYSVPADVIGEYLEEVQEQVFSTVRLPREDETDSLYDRILAICQIYYTDALFAKLYTFYHHNNSSYIEKQISSGASVFPYDKSYIHFIAGGVDAVLIRWIADGLKETPEEIANKLTTMIGRMIVDSE